MSWYNHLSDILGTFKNRTIASHLNAPLAPASSVSERFADGERSRIIISSKITKYSEKPNLDEVNCEGVLVTDEANSHDGVKNGRHNVAFESREDFEHQPSCSSRLGDYHQGLSLGMNHDNNSSSCFRMDSDDRFTRDKEKKEIYIKRNAIDIFEMQKMFGMTEEEPFTQKVRKILKSRCRCNVSSIISLLVSLFPLVRWLPKYKKEYLISDFISGFTIAILHIPQGLAYGILASVNPENGLYVSFFPALVYFFLGTSKHISIGTFAVISLMVSNAVHNIRSSMPPHENNATFNGTSITTSSEYNNMISQQNLEIVTSLAMTVGLLQLFMATFQLGALAVLFSDQMTSGFTTGAAFHVATSQLKDLFGISIDRYSGPLKIVYMYRDIFSNIGNTNIATIIISAIAILILAVVKEQVNDRYKKKLKISVPIDLIVVVIATVLSHFGKFSDKYLVKIMGPIPLGLPNPVIPKTNKIPLLLADSFAIAIVTFAVSLSMAKLFAKKHNYDIKATQELIALGGANVLSSFFACYPCSASLSRSLVQEKAGGKSQVAGLISCALLLVVLLVVAPLFYSLPKCILSCIILVALKGMFMQIRDFIKLLETSKIDALVWLVAVSATVLLDVTYGLITGLVFSILTVVLKNAVPVKSFLGNIPASEMYVDIKKYAGAKETPGVKIFHFGSTLCFINLENFTSALFNDVPLKEVNTCPLAYNGECIDMPIHHIIIDCSCFTNLDVSGLDTLAEVMKKYKEAGITVFLAQCPVSMVDLMSKARFFMLISYHPFCFPTIHDAIQFCF